MQCLNYSTRVVVNTVDGVKSGKMTFYLDDDGKCSISPNITDPDREYYDIDTNKTWNSYDDLENDLDHWCQEKPRDDEGRVVPFFYPL